LGKQDTGVYLLVIKLKSKQRISAGKLPACVFKSGIYLYSGRAKRSLRGRLQRHLKKEKKLFWHIDYFLQKAEIKEIWAKYDSFDECQAVSQVKNLIKDADFPQIKFGSSDCLCPSHLIYLPEDTNLGLLRKKLSLEKVETSGNQV